MFGQVHVVTKTNLDEITPWKKDDFYKLVVKAVKPENSGAEARRVLSIMLDYHFSHILSGVAEYLGQDPDITGGTMGECKTPPEWMRLLRSRLGITFWAHVTSVQFVYMGPLNDKETALRLLQNYFWLWIDYSDR